MGRLWQHPTARIVHSNDMPRAKSAAASAKDEIVEMASDARAAKKRPAASEKERQIVNMTYDVKAAEKKSEQQQIVPEAFNLTQRALKANQVESLMNSLGKTFTLPACRAESISTTVMFNNLAAHIRNGLSYNPELEGDELDPVTLFVGVSSQTSEVLRQLPMHEVFKLFRAAEQLIANSILTGTCTRTKFGTFKLQPWGSSKARVKFSANSADSYIATAAMLDLLEGEKVPLGLGGEKYKRDLEDYLKDGAKKQKNAIDVELVKGEVSNAKALIEAINKGKAILTDAREARARKRALSKTAGDGAPAQKRTSKKDGAKKGASKKGPKKIAAYAAEPATEPTPTKTRPRRERTATTKTDPEKAKKGEKAPGKKKPARGKK